MGGRADIWEREREKKKERKRIKDEERAGQQGARSSRKRREENLNFFTLIFSGVLYLTCQKILL